MATLRLYTVALLLAFTGGIMGLECYLCTYNDYAPDPSGAGCKDPFSSTNVETHTCPSGLYSCAKSVDGQGTTARVCFPTSQCLSSSGCVSGNGATVCCCNGNLCNGAGTARGRPVLALGLAALALAARLLTL